MLSSSEFVADPICVKPESHRVPGNSLAIHQGHLIFSHWPSSLCALPSFNYIDQIDRGLIPLLSRSKRRVHDPREGTPSNVKKNEAELRRSHGCSLSIC